MEVCAKEGVVKEELAIGILWSFAWAWLCGYWFNGIAGERRRSMAPPDAGDVERWLIVGCGDPAYPTHPAHPALGS